MELFTNFPIIPIVTLLLIVGFFIYQLRIYLEEKRKSKTPSVPNLGVNNLKDNSAAFVNKIDHISSAAAVAHAKAPSAAKIKSVNRTLTMSILGLLLLTTGGFLLLSRDTLLSFIPRASISPTSPLIPIATATPFTQPTLSSVSPTSAVTSPSPATGSITPAISPTTALLAQNTTPTAGITAAAATTTTPSPSVTQAPTSPPTSPTSLPTLVTTLVPTTTLTPPLASPTLLAYYGTNEFPTPTPTPRITPTKTPEKPSIPQAGITFISVAIAVVSIFLLAIGFAL